MKIEPGTIASFLATVVVWIDTSTWWAKATVTVAFLIVAAIDVRRAHRSLGDHEQQPNRSQRRP